MRAAGLVSAASVALALALAGCGSSHSSTSSRSSPSSSTASATTASATTASATTATTGTTVRTAAARITPAPDGLRQTAGYATYELCALKPCTGAVPPSLRIKIHTPRLARGTPCIPEAAIEPVKPDVIGTVRATPFIGSRWDGARVTWTAPQSFNGPILIRGREVDGAGALGFGEGRVPYDELQLDAVPGQLHEWPSFTRVRGPGCYAYQIDTAAFSTVIVFKVVR